MIPLIRENPDQPLRSRNSEGKIKNQPSWSRTSNNLFLDSISCNKGDIEKRYRKKERLYYFIGEEPCYKTRHNTPRHPFWNPRSFSPSPACLLSCRPYTPRTHVRSCTDNTLTCVPFSNPEDALTKPRSSMVKSGRRTSTWKLPHALRLLFYLEPSLPPTFKRCHPSLGPWAKPHGPISNCGRPKGGRSPHGLPLTQTWRASHPSHGPLFK